MPLPTSARRKYALVGAAFGLAFPVIALAIRIVQYGLSEALGLILADPLLWIIGTASLFLGIFAWFGGVQNDLLRQQMDEAESARRAAEGARAEIADA